MQTYAETVYVNTTIGSTASLPSAGTGLENPYVFDAAARDIKVLAEKGLVRIVSEQRRTLNQSELISGLQFIKIR